MKRTAALIPLISLVLLILLTACGKTWDSLTHINSDFSSIKTYKDIPEVTESEIAAIESIKNDRESLTYGYLLETESFSLPDGTFSGFTIEVCKLLSDLFGIQFEPLLCDEWEQLKDGIDSKTIDFTGVFNRTPERMKIYNMTVPIAGRTLSLYTLAGSDKIMSEGDVNGKKLGFFAGSVTASLIAEDYPDLSFDAVDISSYSEVPQKLSTGEIDGFVLESVSSPNLEIYDNIESREMFSLVYTHAAITTANHELAPLISVINKYLASGGIQKFFELYRKGNDDYAQYALSKAFTAEERAYIDEHSTKETAVKIAYENENYPVCFYNDVAGEYQGVAYDVLAEISRLTGLRFESAADKETLWSEIMVKLKTGEVAMTAELLHSEDREENYIWSSVPYAESYYALISKIDYPLLESSQLAWTKVGTIKDSAFESKFNLWFPNISTTRYDTLHEALKALDTGQIDLLMGSEYILLTQTHFNEKPEYAVNIRFYEPKNSYFGFNKDAEILRSIIDKSQAHVNTKEITEAWTNKVFDYSKKLSKMQTTYLLIVALILVVVLTVILMMYSKNRRLDKRLLEHTASLYAIYASTPDILFSLDKNLVYISCNHSFEKFAGIPREEIIGKTDNEVFENFRELAEQFSITNKEVIELKSTKVIYEWVVFPNGSKRFLETIKAPMVHDDEITGIMGMARDITEHKAAEDKACEASNAKSMFLANMSHELRTPLNAIIGMSELLLNESLTNKQKSYVEDINVSSHSLLSIMNDILDLAKVEEGRLELNIVNYDFNLFTDNISSMFRFVSEKKGLQFAFEKKGELPKYLLGDVVKLRQILINICGNAVKFTEKGFIRLSVEVVGESLVFEIEDTGLGIREGDLARLFSPFTQTDMQTNRSFEGAGLGLSLSKSFAALMGGSISAESVHGIGTVFTIKVPIVVGDESKIKHGNRNETAKIVIAPSAKILVVDDNDVNLKIAKGILGLYKINAHTAQSGMEAIRMVTETDYDIVFMDHMMPEIDGIETTSRIRALGGKYDQLKIVALTANAIQGVKEMFLENGFNEFVSKPIDTKELTNVLETLLPSDKIAMPETDDNDVTKAPSGDEKKYNDGNILNSIRTIAEINTDIGLSRFSGLEAMYCDSVMYFYKKLLGECDKLSNFLADEDMRNFAIMVHGIKSSLSTIGAMELSEMAFELETASKSGQLSYCEENFPSFLTKLHLLHERMSVIMPERNAAPPLRLEGDAGFLREQVEIAIKAAEDFESALCLEALDKLLAYDFGERVNEHLDNAKNSIDNFDLDRASEFLKHSIYEE